MEQYILSVPSPEEATLKGSYNPEDSGTPTKAGPPSGDTAGSLKMPALPAHQGAQGSHLDTLCSPLGVRCIKALRVLSPLSYLTYARPTL